MGSIETTASIVSSQYDSIRRLVPEYSAVDPIPLFFLLSFFGLFWGLLQLRIEEFDDHFVDFRGVEFRTAVTGIFDDVQLRGHLVFLERLFQNDTLMHGNRGIFGAVDDQERGILFVDVGDRVGAGDAVLVFQDRAANQQ